jgi:hypothetical protein
MSLGVNAKNIAMSEIIAELMRKTKELEKKKSAAQIARIRYEQEKIAALSSRKYDHDWMW